ncbi:MAG: glycine cleavage system aminomethyltransferase GcvT [Pseudomonadota bacterium]
MADLARTVLYALHVELGAKMVPFAGYEMPVQYPMGVMKEHLACRSGAGLFDVSHMGQVIVRPEGTMEEAALALEALMPVDIAILKPGRQRYGLFTTPQGGIIDDLMVANRGDHFLLVVNAATKAGDIAHLQANLSGVTVEPIEGRALIALQGPKAEDALAAVAPGVRDMRFMDVVTEGDLWISRSGYTGEDGFEVSVPEDQAEAFVRTLLGQPDVHAIGLGARDSLRLEAGLCLYGSDIDTTTTPIEADLGWAIGKARRSGGARAGGFPGADRILAEIEGGAARKRVGLLPEGRAPMRAGTELFSTQDAESPMGSITSGAFGPSIEGPMSMGYVTAEHAAPGTKVFAELRGKRLPAIVTPMPFRPSTYKR